MTTEKTLYKCSQIGCSGTTDVHVKKLPNGRFEARVGIAIMGMTNMDESGFKACSHDPFHDRFYDNFARGLGDTQEEAIASMKKNMKATADSLWAA
jgi:hypothetical protein